MERDKAEQHVWQITDLYDNIGDEDGAIDLLNEYANQRVIEELERLKPNNVYARDVSYSCIEARIKELKQD